VKAETETEVRRERGKMSWGVKVIDATGGEGAERGVLIEDVEKQRLDEARAPCLN
jgi:hypothetical protein